MSLRDYFAAKAMQGILCNTDNLQVLCTAAMTAGHRNGLSITAQKAYELADAMLEARNK